MFQPIWITPSIFSIFKNLLYPDLLFFLILGTLAVSISCGAPKVKSNSQPITHEIWNSLLQKHVSPDGQVNYKGFIQDSLLFQKYLQLLSNHHPNKKNWSAEERLAYWINAYNAFTVKMIADHYPVKSIKDIKNGIPFVNTVWDIKFIKIEGQEFDLNNIEHGIIRKRFKEPRIHFAVNCASISCPRLRNEAYHAEQLDAQLADQTRYFINQSGKNKITSDRLELSKIFSWFKGDFKDTHGSVINFLNEYAAIPIDKNAEISYKEYDWNLNGE